MNYTPLSMAYYAYDSTAKFLSLGSTVLIIMQKNGTGATWCWKIESVLGSYGDFSEDQLNAKLR